MAFPASPINNQTHTWRGRKYVYNSTKHRWQQSGVEIPATSTSGTSAGFSGTVTAADLNVSGTITSGTLSVTNATVTNPINGTVSNATYAATAGSATSATSAASATTATTATTANALNTSNNYQVNSIGIGTAGSGTAGQLRATNTIVAYYSDERLKTKISDIDNALDKIDQLSGFLYVENDIAKAAGFSNSETQVALSAQAVQRVQPEAVKPAPFDIAQNSDGTEYSKSGENYLTVQYERLVPLLVEGIKELRREINQLKKGLDNTGK